MRGKLLTLRPSLSLLDSSLEKVCHSNGVKRSKRLLTRKSSVIDSAMGYFDTPRSTHLTVDASPVGLVATLWQSNPVNDSDIRPISFASKTLSAVWGCEKFHMYLFGCKFKLHTNNKSVEMILNNPKSNPGARMKLWVLRISQYNFTVVHVPGKDNISDYLFRLCQDSASLNCIGGMVSESFVNLAVRMV